MTDLPRGTVTFCFTDVVGSSGLWDRDPTAMREALARHDELVEGHVARHSGVVVRPRGEGDSRFAVFSRATQALMAACDLQKAFVAEPWPTTEPLRVRIALHTGEAEVRGADYYGQAVNRCARLRSSAHGGQVLVSVATAELSRDGLPPNLGLRLLGAHRLKDLQRPEHVFQLIHPDLPADFPPLQSLDAIPNNLPGQLTSFIGREREIGEVERLLLSTRLLTLTGSGGCGKTRLALQVAADLDGSRDGVWLVELAPLSDPALVPQSVASTLGIREQPGRLLIVTIAEHLKARQVLLLLDNCEHLIEACARLADDLLRACPGLRIMATSREPLGVGGETAWRVPSLPLPDLLRLPPLDSLTQYEAVRLFIERAVTALSTFVVTNRNAPAVAQVCHRLDGIPLAIELAAARVKVLPVDQIAVRLDNRLNLLTGGSRTNLPHQQTLRATMDWSHDLLPEGERVLFRRLAVFAGGWTLDAAEAVCAGDGIEPGDVLDLLSHLVDKSIVTAGAHEDAIGEGRYWLLETVRQYAAEKLQNSGEEEALRRRHLDHFLRFVQDAEPKLRGLDQEVWVGRLKGELDNLRAALEWSRKDKVSLDAGLQMAGSLWWFWFTQGMLNEGRAWLMDTLARSRGMTTPARVSVLYGAGAIAWNQGDLARAAECAGEALGLCREFNDRLGIIYCLSILGGVSLFQGSHEQAAAMFEEALSSSREMGYPWETATVLGLLGWAAHYRGDFERAAALCQESLTLFRRVGDNWGAGSILCHLGRAAWRLGDYERARSLLEESITIARGLGNSLQTAMSLHESARLALATGEPDRAAALEREALIVRNDQGERWGIAECLEGLAAVAVARGEQDRAARLFGAAAALREKIGVPVPLADQPGMGSDAHALQAALGHEKFDEQWALGGTMAPDQAIEFALGAPVARTEPR